MTKLGPTGDHPFGRIDETDDGGIQLGVASDHQNGVVRVQFGATVAWLGLYPAQAKVLGAALIKHADEIFERRIMTEPHIIINGMELTDAQAMALRVAATGFQQEMGDSDALGDDDAGRQLVRGYRDRISEVLKLMLEMA